MLMLCVKFNLNFSTVKTLLQKHKFISCYSLGCWLSACQQSSLLC